MQGDISFKLCMLLSLSKVSINAERYFAQTLCAIVVIQCTWHIFTTLVLSAEARINAERYFAQTLCAIVAQTLCAIVVIQCRWHIFTAPRFVCWIPSLCLSRWNPESCLRTDAASSVDKIKNSRLRLRKCILLFLPKVYNALDILYKESVQRFTKLDIVLYLQRSIKSKTPACDCESV